MRQSQKILEAIDIYSYRRYAQQMFVVMGIILFSLFSGSAFALENNPGSNLTCPAGSTKGFLSNGSYDNLVTSFGNGSYQSVVSQNASLNGSTVTIPLKIKMSNVGSNAGASVSKLTSGGYSAIRFSGSTPTTSSVRDEITLEFQNSLNNDPLFLNKVALSAFDIDKLSSGNNYWDDNVKFVGITQSGTTINGSFQTILNSNVINTSGEGLRLDRDANCGNTLESQCQGSVVFSDPVKSVKMIYTNTDNDTTNRVTSRLFDFRLDSYCYQPSSYEITKDDGTDSIGVSNITDYLITVTNNGNTPLTNIVLKDPSVTGLIKQNNITCDTTDSTNTCTTAPTKTELESSNGFTISTLAVGKTYSIRVPTKVTATEGSTITNTATIKASNLDLKSASDSNTVAPIFSGGSPVAPASCPSGHKMYYIGNKAPDYTPRDTLPINWTAGIFAKEYIFGNIKFNLSFTDRLRLRTNHPTGNNVTDATANAINMYHDSYLTPIDHKLTATINKPVSKYGFVVQDLDANQPGKYIESITLATPGGFFSKTENKPFQLSNGNQTISGTAWNNCNTANPCNFNIDWGYKPASTPFAITHGNPYSEGFTTNSNAGYVVGYSDFYFCLAPPKLVVKKALNGNRVNDSVDSADQFEIKVTGDSLAANSFTTTGSAAAINNGTSDLLSLVESKTYTISERVINGSVGNYSATYVCNNATTGSTFTTTSGTATLNAETIPTRSFTLSNLNYGDEVTCTITNTPSSYTFSGTVFNDNGGLSGKTSDDKNGTFISNIKYFNGKLDTGESGISGTTYPDLKVSLTNCAGTNIGNTTAQTVSSTGQYSFTVPSSALNGISEVCMVQTEPNGWIYTVDTTPIKLPKTLQNNVYNYDNLNFGKVTTDQTALVLKKYQYVRQCDANLIYTASTINGADISTPTDGFSMNPASKVDPGQCIAYKIEAYNHGHIALNNIRITDILQKSPIESRFHLPVAAGIAATLRKTDEPTSPLINIGDNGAIITAPFALNNNAATTSVSKATLYFNTKYGTSVGGI